MKKRKVAAEILVADDEAVVRRAFTALLEGEGYSVVTARNGAEALAKFSEKKPDLVLLDIMMPKMNGIAACEEMRKLDELVPIIFFTAMPSEAAMVRGLGLGADDYIDKSKSPEEFIARIRAALRRNRIYLESPVDGKYLMLGELEVDFNAKKIEGDGLEDSLTRSETQLLRLLSSRRGEFFTTDEILSALRGEGYNGTSTSVRTLVSRLKVKLGRKGALILNDRGGGYALSEK